MSKRFGRKQKRQAQKDINSLEVSLQNTKTRLENLRNDLDMFYRIDEDIARVMGSESALRLVAPVRRMDLKNELRVYQHMPLPASLSAEVLPSELSITYLNLKKLFVQMKHDPNQYRSLIRLRASDGKTSAMYMDDITMNRMGHRDIQIISEDIGKQLVHHFKGIK